MPDRNKSCQECGKSINIETVTCPYCGHKHGAKITGSSTVKKEKKITRDGRDNGRVLGEGMLRRSTDAGFGSIKEAVRKGGRDGNVQVCMKCRHVQSKIRNTCEECGSKLKK